MPVCFVIFGITGDLAKTKLIPAIYQLYLKGLLPKKFKIIGFSRRDIPLTDFHRYIAKIIGQNDTKFLKRFIYVQGQFNYQADYKKLGEELSKIDDLEFKECSHKLFYLAVPPIWYGPIAERLSRSGLTIPCGGKKGWTRILVEKPFGKDIKTARKLNLKLGNLFKEEQIFRIDHYLAKETSQKILDFRFKSGKLEKYWNNKYIEGVKIELLEKEGVKDRGAFYDRIGALRDVGQNHLLQMLALTAMNRPRSFQAKSIRNERAKVLENILPISKRNMAKYVSRGQYKKYKKEKGVKKDSTTETYFKMTIHLKNPRWRNVAFQLESGKAMPRDRSSVKIIFKNSQKPVNFDYHGRPKSKFMDAYEKVLFDCVRGDHTIFNSTREVEAAWEFITPILKNWWMLPLDMY
jgi:glucose-6-phosphate 1-dehydrogenase